MREDEDMKERNFLYTLFGGFCMALADSVPGVSGGTIAFIMGFYDRFISSLSALFHGERDEKLAAFGYLVKLGVGWTVGMGLAVTVLADAFTSGIYEVSSMFLGFVLVSIPLVLMEERQTLTGGVRNYLFTVLGALLVIGLSALNLSSLVHGMGQNMWTVLYAFLAGALAISAMVLPGISGSSLLMSCGLYLPVITAVKDAFSLKLDMFWLLAAVAVGALAGAILSPRALKRLLDEHRSAAIYAILGMMLGSIYAIVIGPTTLKIPQHMMTMADFDVLWFAVGAAAVLSLSAFKALVARRKSLCEQV